MTVRGEVSRPAVNMLGKFVWRPDNCVDLNVKEENSIRKKVVNVSQNQLRCEPSPEHTCNQNMRQESELSVLKW